MRQQKSPLDELFQEFDTLKQKIQEIEELAKARPNKFSVKDIAKQARVVLANCEKKIEAIEKMASKKRR